MPATSYLILKSPFFPWGHSPPQPTLRQPRARAAGGLGSDAFLSCSGNIPPETLITSPTSTASVKPLSMCSLRPCSHKLGCSPFQGPPSAPLPSVYTVLSSSSPGTQNPSISSLKESLPAPPNQPPKQTHHSGGQPEPEAGRVSVGAPRSCVKRSWMQLSRVTRLQRHLLPVLGSA